MGSQESGIFREYLELNILFEYASLGVVASGCSPDQQGTPHALIGSHLFKQNAALLTSVIISLCFFHPKKKKYFAS